MPNFNRVGITSLWLGVLLTLFANMHPALADNPQQTQQALLKAQGLLKQIAQQKSLAEAELAKLRGELAGTEKALAKKESEVETQKMSLAQVEAGLSAASQRSAALVGNLERSKVRLDQTTDKLHEVAGMYKATRAKLQEADAARQTLVTQLAVSTKELQDAEKKNLALYQLNQTLLSQYQQKSVWDALRQREPFTGIGKVTVENQVQDLEDRNYQQVRTVNADGAEK